ncbi:hypothetical protein HHI36_014046 [Cryptolaemus montrouzieri]|uniref:H/ACA ribonucleoprotein complex non-core subunit NAF1 n=1 Tax=Cryptolaemus montrouzieri TaxID=559131 RepID=A0ABD2N2J3_9CUCU
MSSEISVGKNENTLDEQPSSLFHQNSDNTQSKMSNSESNSCKLPNSEEATAVVQKTPPHNEEIGVISAENKVEENLIEKVNKLDITVKQVGESSESSNSTGTVVQNKLSESLSYLQDYNSDDDNEDGEDDSSESDDDVAMQGLQFRDFVGDSEDSEADSETDDYDSMDGIFDNKGKSEGAKPQPEKKEIEKTDSPWMSDLGSATAKVPDISTLQLNNKEEFQHIGNIDCVLDKFVTIESLPAMPAYDLDTLFFVEDGQKVLGYVFDVMGPVSSPIYVVHLDTVERVQNLQLKRGTKIYCAPKSKYTKYVFLHELMKIKGSDASWVEDAEVPPEFEEFSDDEKERQKKSLKNKAAKRKHSLERHQEFEASMNKINQLNSRLHNMVDARNPLRQRINDSRARTERPRPTGNPSAAGTPPRWLNHPPPPPPHQEVPQVLLESQSLESYLQNCTAHFMQQWGQHPPPPAPFPAEQFYMPPPSSIPANYIPAFDPSTPPPTYIDYVHHHVNVSESVEPPISRYANGVPRPANPVGKHRQRNGTNFRNNNRPGPSSGY